MNNMQLCRPDPVMIGLVLFAILCASSSGFAEPTIGEQFRQIMAEIDAKCRKEKLGPYLDPNEPPRSPKRTNGSCEILKVKPVDPLATEEGRFAYSIKLPPPHDKPKVEYKKGMSAETYFKELCEKEEGDFVFRTVEGVEGIKIMRPIPKATGVPLWDEAEGPSPGLFLDQITGIYKYVDAVELLEGSQTATRIVHYFIDPKLPIGKPPYGKMSFPVETSSASYGFTFRNSLLENRELGIKGRELIIVDLDGNKVLAIRRRFSKLQFSVPKSAQVMQGTPCRLLGTEDTNNRFIAKTLRPADHAKGDNR